MTVAEPADSAAARRHRQALFRPSRQQQAYLEAWLDPQAPKTITGISAHINVPRRTMHHWLEDEAFVSWFNGEAQRATDHWWQPILLKVAELALQGSIEHMKLFAQIRGGLRRASEDVSSPITVVIGVPRPAGSDDQLKS